MNDPQFDNALRAAMPVPVPSLCLDQMIDHALAKERQTYRVSRRVVLTFATAAATVLGVVAFPAVQAQASLNGIVSALDRQTRVRITTYSVAEDGSARPSATTTIANGDVAYMEASGTRQTFDVGSKTYSLDPTLGKFIVGPRRSSRSLRLSDMLGPTGEFSVGKRTDVQRLTVDGRAVLRATVENMGLPERYVIDADAVTDLPISARVDARERGAWRTRQRLVFDYAARVPNPKPDLARFPATTAAAANAAFGKAMIRDTLGEMTLDKGRVVIRKVDVAADGTVFVAFQAGDRNPNSWRGYTLDVRGDGGTRYLRYGQIIPMDDNPFMSKDGKVEVEMFVPAAPIAPKSPRTISITAIRMPDGGLGRKTHLNVTDGDRVVWQGPVLNGWPYKDAWPPSTTLLRLPAAKPTCESSPVWAARYDFRFGNPIAAEMEKANVRAHGALESKDWSEAERWLEEQLRLMREHERRGYGPWSQSEVLDNLDKVRAAMGRVAP